MIQIDHKINLVSLEQSEPDQDPIVQCPSSNQVASAN